MNDKSEMILASLLMLDQLAEQFDVLSGVYPDFADLAAKIRGYRDDFAGAARISDDKFAAYKSIILDEVGNAVD